MLRNIRGYYHGALFLCCPVVAYMGLAICKITLQTSSTPAFSWRGTVIFKTGTFAPSCSLILSLGSFFTDTVILEAAFAQSVSTKLPPPLSLLFLLLSSTHSFVTLSSFSDGKTDKITLQQFQSVPCKDLAQAICLFLFMSCISNSMGNYITQPKEKKRKECNHAETGC